MSAPDDCRSTPAVDEPLGSDAARDLAAGLKALADPVRLRLLSLIASRGGGEICVCDLAAPFQLSQPTISHHLGVLRSAGLISCERRGSWVYYRREPEALGRLADALAELTATAEPVTAVIGAPDRTGSVAVTG